MAWEADELIGGSVGQMAGSERVNQPWSAAGAPSPQ